MENMEFSFNTLGGLIIKGCVYIYFGDVLPSVKLNIQDHSCFETTHKSFLLVKTLANFNSLVRPRAALWSLLHRGTF